MLFQKFGKRTMENDSVTAHSLRAMCQNILHLMATTVDVVESVSISDIDLLNLIFGFFSVSFFLESFK